MDLLHARASGRERGQRGDGNNSGDVAINHFECSSPPSTSPRWTAGDRILAPLEECGCLSKLGRPAEIPIPIPRKLDVLAKEHCIRAGDRRPCLAWARNAKETLFILSSGPLLRRIAPHVCLGELLVGRVQPRVVRPSMPKREGCYQIS